MTTAAYTIRFRIRNLCAAARAFPERRAQILALARKAVAEARKMGIKPAIK